jgi:hypothetical protein
MMNNMKAICNKIGISHIGAPGYPNMKQSFLFFITLRFSPHQSLVENNRMIKPEYHCLKLYKLIHNSC